MGWEANLVHMSTSAPSFENILKLYIYVSKNRHIYFMNTYTCTEYSCDVSVEIALYFELYEKNVWLRIGVDIYQKFICVV
jgi:hypothetical protein